MSPPICACPPTHTHSLTLSLSLSLSHTQTHTHYTNIRGQRMGLFALVDCRPIYMHTYTHTHTHTPMYMHTYTHTHTHAHTHTHTHIRIIKTSVADGPPPHLRLSTCPPDLERVLRTCTSSRQLSNCCHELVKLKAFHALTRVKLNPELVTLNSVPFAPF